MLRKLFVFSLFSVASISHAFTIDNMLVIAQDDGNGVFTLTSSKKEPEFIKGTISKINVVNGKIEKVELTKDNLPIWDLALLPSKLILNPGERRRVAIKNLCQIDCDNLEKDKVYQITFLPSVVEDNPSQSRIGINFGYAPYFIVPAKLSNVDYDIQYDGNKLHVKNKGNTFFHMQIDKCKPDEKKRVCKQTNTILSGREKVIELQDGLKNLSELSIKIANHDYSYNEKIKVIKN